MRLEIQKFLTTSSVHGLAYITAKHHMIEKIFWSILLTLSITCTLTLIIQLGIKMKSVPIVAYLSDTSVKVSEIYFPAVTVCPDFLPYTFIKTDNLLMPEHRWDWFFKYEKHTSERHYIENNEYLAETVDERRLNMTYSEILNEIENQEINPNDLGLKILKRLQVIDLIENRGTFQKINLSITTDDFMDVLNDFFKPHYEQHINFVFAYNAQTHASEIITPYGLCNTFNLAYSKDLLNINQTSDDFYYQLFPNGHYRSSPPLPFDDYPEKDSGYPYGLKIVLSHEDIFSNVKSTNLFNGNHFYFHDPFELPSSSSAKFLLASRTNYGIKIKPQITSIDDSIAHYDSIDRNCYLDTERTLKFFKKYTKANCIQECLTDFVLKQCKCVEFFMIRNSTTRICSANEKNCTENAKNEFEGQQQSCGCLQPCNHVKYEFEVTEKGTNRGSIFASIEYSDTIYSPLIRKQHFEMIDFLSYFGGLLGLFAGISFLSIVETIYWFTARVFENKMKKSSSIVEPFSSNENHQKVDKISNFIIQFTKESSIHGLSHLFGSSLVKRLAWTFIFIFLMVLCFDMITKARDKIPDSRVVAFDDTFKILKKIPFPAITISPDYIIKNEITNRDVLALIEAKRLESIGEVFKATEDLLRDTAAARFCEKEYHVNYGDSHYDLRNYTMEVLYNNTRLDWFQQQKFSINEEFHPVFAAIPTQRGMAYTFNIIDAEEMLNFKSHVEEFRYFRNITSNFAKNSTKLVKTLKFDKGNKLNFQFNFKQKINRKLENQCLLLGLAIHNNDVMPRFEDIVDFSSIRYGINLDVEITPQIIKTDPDLKKLNPLKRECYFEDEKQLKYFKKYSKENCIIECFANYSRNFCYCSEFWRIVENEDYCYKYGGDALCPPIVQPFFHMLSIPSSPNCSCLPTCDSVTYHIRNYLKNSTQLDEISIALRVNTEDAILFRRYQQFTFSDVVSYVGGLLGLFAGISMLSIVEIFYFFVIRVVVDVWRALNSQQ